MLGRLSCHSRYQKTILHLIVGGFFFIFFSLKLVKKSVWLNSSIFSFYRKLTNRTAQNRKASKAINPPRQVQAKHKQGPHRCLDTGPTGHREGSGMLHSSFQGLGGPHSVNRVHSLALQERPTIIRSISVCQWHSSLPGQFPIGLTLTKNLQKGRTT